MSAAVLGAGGWGAAAAIGAAALLAGRASGRERERRVRAAHELRGALTAIGLTCEAALAGPRRDVDPRRALAVEFERARLALADLARERGNGDARVIECFAAARVLEDGLAAAAPLAAAHGVVLSGGWAGPPARVRGERVRLHQALANLIANAIEHGGGAVAVRGRCTAGSARFEVGDAGTGLPAPLEVLCRHARGGVGSRGRGLAIAADVAARHDGAVVAAPGCGACVTLVVPAA